MLRDLQSQLMGKMVVIPGIVTHASRTHIKTTKLAIKCKNCGHEKILETGQGYGSINVPRTCDNGQNTIGREKCPLDPYRIVSEKCTFID